MKLLLTEEMTFESIADRIQTIYPQYTTKIKKNPVARFQYIEIKKSGFVGVWIRIFEKKGKVQLIKAMPSPWVRALLGGLLLIAFTHKAQTRVRKEIGASIIKTFNTKKI